MRIDVPLADEDKSRLSQALGDGEDVEQVARVVAQAGAVELLAMATGRAVFSSIADLKAFRIFCLLEQGISLSQAEALVAAVFKVPSSTAKRLVSFAIARYSVELQERVRSVLVETLDTAEWDQERSRWNVRIPTVFVRDRMLDLLGRLDLPDPVPAQRGPVWRFADETYQALRAQLGLDFRETK